MLVLVAVLVLVVAGVVVVVRALVGDAVPPGLPLPLAKGVGEAPGWQEQPGVAAWLLPQRPLMHRPSRLWLCRGPPLLVPPSTLPPSTLPPQWR